MGSGARLLLLWPGDDNHTCHTELYLDDDSKLIEALHALTPTRRYERVYRDATGDVALLEQPNRPGPNGDRHLWAYHAHEVADVFVECWHNREVLDLVEKIGHPVVILWT
jgi:hypothetical protein